MTGLQSDLDQLSSLLQEEAVNGQEAVVQGGPGGRRRQPLQSAPIRSLHMIYSSTDQSEQTGNQTVSHTWE